jgi:uncharacterized protein (TIGR02594 family)
LIQFGPTRAQREIARKIIDGAPRGDTPIKVAQYFLSPQVDTHFIERWPRSDVYNPLIVDFFQATAYLASNDMIPWCAAFVNWCLERSARTGSRSPSSQSFLNDKVFKQTDSARVGDLVVFTCHRVSDDRSIGLGHVGFVASPPGADRLEVLGGNQSQDGGSSTICQGLFPFTSRESSRNGIRVRLKLNRFVRIG